MPTVPSEALKISMAQIARYISEHAKEPLTLHRLASGAGMSVSHLQRSFTRVIGVSPRQYHAARRMAEFKSQLRSGGRVLDAVFAAGYGSTSRVYEQVSGALGMTPTAYRSGGAAEVVTWTTRTTSLGELLMAATERGVCLVEFGDAPEMLEARVKEEYPEAELEPAGEDSGEPVDAWIMALEEYLDRGGPLPDLPLDLRGTAFQIKVWQFLRQIKPGEVVSYSQLAKAIGHPGAARAVGSACGANRVAVLIPCHRAIRGDGSYGGYRWGLDRKDRLLQDEALRAASE